jgi:hypothetical protein
LQRCAAIYCEAQYSHGERIASHAEGIGLDSAPPVMRHMTGDKPLEVA